MPTASTSHDTPTRGPAKPLPYVISGVLLVAAVVFPLLVPTYAHATPHLGAFPFFYWYQMLWVPIEAVLIGISYVLITREDKRRRAVLIAATQEKNDDGGELQ